ncbi:MAG: serine hydrolase domain-containing protein, partial [Armatimonadota bacterium]
MNAASFEAQIVDAIEAAIAEKITPGAVCLLGRSDETVSHVAVGERCLEPERLPMERDTVFDMASVTKPVATATVIFQLAERGALTLDDPVALWLPGFTGDGREGVTLADLLAHCSGLPAYWRPGEDASDLPPEKRRPYMTDAICGLPLAYPPREGSIYSCLGFILLASVAEAVGGRSLDELAREDVFKPLEMTDTCFCPPPEMARRCAATERLPEGTLVGVVHDENARYLGGVGGNAGMFSTAADLARFARTILGGGELDGNRILSEESVEALLAPRPQLGDVRRTLGWRMANADDVHLHGAPTIDSV